MNTSNTNRRAEIIARNLRLIAAAVENASNPQTMRTIASGLQDAISLVNLCLYDYQRTLIENAAIEFDLHETIPY